MTDDGRVVPHDEAKAFDVVILAVGFGIEALPFDLPWNSYWRVDPLGQTLLDEDIAQPSVVIVGSGDGALIDVLRSCVQTFDEGALLDHLLSVTLNNTKLRDRVREIARDCEPGAVYTATANPTRFRREAVFSGRNHCGTS